MKRLFQAAIVSGLFTVPAFASVICPDGSWAESQCNICPDGTWHDECGICPDGHFGCSSSGGSEICPDGSWHTSCGICPNGQYGC